MWIDFLVFLFEDEAQIIKPKHVMTTRIKSILSKVGKSIKDLALNNVLSPNFLSPRRHLKIHVYLNDWLGGSKWLNPQQINSHEAFSRFFFSSKFHHIRMISVSGHCVPFIFGTCQTFMGISINYATRTISRFFKTCISADFLQFGLIVSRVIKILTQLKHLLLMKMKCRHPLNSENFHYNFLIELPP